MDTINTAPRSVDDLFDAWRALGAEPGLEFDVAIDRTDWLRPRREPQKPKRRSILLQLPATLASYFRARSRKAIAARVHNILARPARPGERSAEELRVVSLPVDDLEHALMLVAEPLHRHAPPSRALIPFIRGEAVAA